jgi:hypothetical protein
VEQFRSSINSIHGTVKEIVEDGQEDLIPKEELLQVTPKNICASSGSKWPESRNIATPISGPGGGIGRRSRLKICRS